MHMSSRQHNRQELADAPDEVLIEAMNAGEQTALRHLYRRHSALVYSLALQILKRKAEAEDITQEVFLSLWRRNTYDPARGSLRRFLVVMTRSRAIDRLRSRRSRHGSYRRLHDLNCDETGRNVPLETVTYQEQAQRVREALTTLPDTEREVLEIAYYQGLSQKAIAQKLNIPVGTVKSRTRQALQKLRRAFNIR
mgnify:CR=1 FL=1